MCVPVKIATQMRKTKKNKKNKQQKTQLGLVQELLCGSTPQVPRVCVCFECDGASFSDGKKRNLMQIYSFIIEFIILEYQYIKTNTIKHSCVSSACARIRCRLCISPPTSFYSYFFLCFSSIFLTHQSVCCSTQSTPVHRRS